MMTDTNLDWRIKPILADGQSMLLFGDHSTGKSWVAMLLGLLVARGGSSLGLEARPGRVLYLDWLDDPAVMQRRMVLISNALDCSQPPGFLYRRMYNWLPDALPGIRGSVIENQIDLVVIDSAMMAVPDVTSEECFDEYHAAIRSLGVSTLTITGEGARRWPIGDLGWGSFHDITFRMTTDATGDPTSPVFRLEARKTPYICMPGQVFPEKQIAFRFAFEDRDLVADRVDISAIWKRRKYPPVVVEFPMPPKAIIDALKRNMPWEGHDDDGS